MAAADAKFEAENRVKIVKQCCAADFKCDKELENEEIDGNCSICFNFTCEPVKFPNKKCNHRYCQECIYGIFNRSVMNVNQVDFYAKCPMCREYATVNRKQSDRVLSIDTFYQEKIRINNEEEFKMESDKLQKIRDFNSKYAVIEFEVGFRRNLTKSKKYHKLDTFVRIQNQEHRHLVNKVINKMVVEYDKIWKRNQSVLANKVSGLY